jgi:hypothetical protein
MQATHMDVITDTGPIRGGVVCTEDIHMRPASHSHLGHKRHEVVWRPIGIFACENKREWLGLN